MTGTRPSYKIDCNRPGSDVAALARGDRVGLVDGKAESLGSDATTRDGDLCGQADMY